MDLKDEHVKDNKYVCCLFKQSLNLQYTEVLRPVEVTKPEMSYYEVRQELLRLELAGKVYTTIARPMAHVAASTGQQQDSQYQRGGGSRNNRGRQPGRGRGNQTQGRNDQQSRKASIKCHKCGEYGHYKNKCAKAQQQQNTQQQMHTFCFKYGKEGHSG